MRPNSSRSLGQFRAQQGLRSRRLSPRLRSRLLAENGQLTVTPTRIIISRRGALGFLSQGHKGEKEIDIVQISAIQFKKNGPLTVGYIQFSFLGGSETKRGINEAVRDENTILFNSSQEPAFERAKSLIDRYRTGARHQSSGQSPPMPRDSLDDLERLAELRDKGVITADDFEAKKRQILGI
jgi:Short C-terminal domain